MNDTSTSPDAARPADPARRPRGLMALGAATAAVGILAASTSASAWGTWSGSSTTTTVKATTTTTAKATSTTTTSTTTTTTKPSGWSGETSSDDGAESLDDRAADLAAQFAAWNSSRSIFRPEVAYAIGAFNAYQAGVKGAGVDVALIDTGVAPVPGLAAADAVLNGPDLSLDHQAGMPASIDGFGHGTHLAGIIAGRDGGIAPASRLVNVKVGASDGAADVSQVIAAIDWVVTHRRDAGMNIRVINLAFGTDSLQDYRTSPLTHAVESAWRNGIVVVVSSGNTGGALANPATDPFVLTVGAADINDPYSRSDDALAPYSSVGTAARPVDLLAPGTSITSLRVPGGLVDTLYPDSQLPLLGNVYAKGSGTSQAAAVTSGAVALLLQARPTMTPDQVKALLRSTARPISGVPSTAQGGGVIDLARALSVATPAATQTFPYAVGTGSIEAARGTAHLAADDGSLLQGEVDVMGQPWVGSTWAPRSTAGTAWTGGSWNGALWAGSDLEATMTVDGVAWQGRSWRSVAWAARTWRADLWAARTWRSELWAGRTWRSTGWS